MTAANKDTSSAKFRVGNIVRHSLDHDWPGTYEVLDAAECVVRAHDTVAIEKYGLRRTFSFTESYLTLVGESPEGCVAPHHGINPPPLDRAEINPNARPLITYAEFWSVLDEAKAANELRHAAEARAQKYEEALGKVQRDLNEAHRRIGELTQRGARHGKR